MVLLYTYYDAARQLGDYAIDPPEGYCGSNWRPEGEHPDRESAARAGEAFVAALPADFSRGSETAPTF